MTVVGHTIYAKVIAATINRQNINYRLCTTNNRIITYEPSAGELIQLEGPRNISSSEQLPVVTYKPEELLILEEYTVLCHLNYAQQVVLQDMDRIAGCI